MTCDDRVVTEEGGMLTIALADNDTGRGPPRPTPFSSKLRVYS